MGVRKNQSMGFVDAMLEGLGGPRSAALRERLDAAMAWKSLAALIAASSE